MSRAAAADGAKLLYDARISQGIARSSGTLAVVLRADAVTAILTGPFGSPLAHYENGALTGQGIRPVPIDPAALHALITGAWSGPDPTVTGISGDAARLAWPGVEGVLDVPRSVFESLRVDRAEGSVEAVYDGARNPLPEKVDLQDLKSGSHLKLRLLGMEKPS